MSGTCLETSIGHSSFNARLKYTLNALSRTRARQGRKVYLVEPPPTVGARMAPRGQA